MGLNPPGSPSHGSQPKRIRWSLSSRRSAVQPRSYGPFRTVQVSAISRGTKAPRLHEAGISIEVQARGGPTHAPTSRLFCSLVTIADDLLWFVDESGMMVCACAASVDRPRPPPGDAANDRTALCPHTDPSCETLAGRPVASGPQPRPRFTIRPSTDRLADRMSQVAASTAVARSTKGKRSAKPRPQSCSSISSDATGRK